MKKKNKKIEEMTLVKEEIKSIEPELEKIMKEWRVQMLEVPNIPDISVPDGDSSSENQEIKVWGEKREFNF